MFPVINCTLRKWQTSQKWAFVFFRGGCRAYHYCRFRPLFPPSVYRETHHCPAATASGLAFWVVFERTSVSPVQKQLRLQGYLWGLFWYLCIFTSSTRTLGFFFLHHPLLKEKLEDDTVYTCLFLEGKTSLKEEKVLWKAFFFFLPMNVTSCCMNMSSG